MNLTDTHAHICDPVFDDDRMEVMQRAQASGVSRIIAVGETIQDARNNLLLSEYHPMLKPAAGLYPTHLDISQTDEMTDFIRANRKKLVAIGEVGLDFWAVKDPEEREVQKEIFRQFIRLSAETGLPLNVHSRSAGRHAIALLLEHGATKVQMHAFDGKAATALPGVEAGFFFSVPPSIVRSRQKQKLVRQLPLSCLLVESDSPVLGPDPAAKNEPANIRIAVREIARIKNCRQEEVVEAVVENTLTLYGENIMDN